MLEWENEKPGGISCKVVNVRSNEWLHGYPISRKIQLGKDKPQFFHDLGHYDKTWSTPQGSATSMTSGNILNKIAWFATKKKNFAIYVTTLFTGKYVFFKKC